jgi:hypothetical protein
MPRPPQPAWLKKWAIAIIAASTLLACGGGGGQGVPSAPVADAPKAVTVLFAPTTAPTFLVNDPGGEDQFPRDAGFVATFDLGQVPITEDDLGVGLASNSWTAPTGSSPIKTMNYSWMPSERIHPWADGQNRSVCTDFRAAVPESRLQGGALGTYAGADIWLRDGSVGKATSGKQIIVSAFFFVDGDGDGPYANYGPKDYLAPLNAAQFGGPLDNSRWYTTTAGWIRTVPWSEPERFGFCVSRDQAMFMFAAASEMLGGMVDIHDVVIHQALLSNETALGTPSTQDPAGVGAVLASFFSEWTVSLVQADATKGPRP